MSDITINNSLSFFGANREAILCRDREVMLSGPADTGKTIAMLWKLDAIAAKYPNASLVMARKHNVDLWSTVVESFKKFILRDRSIRVFGGERPDFYEYPNRSRIWTAGLDKPGKVLSAEHDIIYVNQAEELSLPDWETLLTRTSGRAGNVPYNQTIGDCNPAHATHWIVTRARSGPLTKFNSSHRDNPDLYDQTTGEMTEEGQRRLDALKNLTGSRLLRLFHGLWATPEGAIYDVFDDTKHKVKAYDPPRTWPRIVGIDPFGAYIAAVWLAFDQQNAIVNVYREYYEPFGETTPGHVRNIIERSAGDPIFVWVGGGPSERQARVDFAAAGIPLLEPPISDVWAGIDRVYQLLQEFSLVIHDSCPQLLDEIGAYRRKIDRDGGLTDNIQDKEFYHLLDALRYAVVWMMSGEAKQRVVYSPIRIGNY